MLGGVRKERWQVDDIDVEVEDATNFDVFSALPHIFYVMVKEG